jgi:hypothetical protein
VSAKLIGVLVLIWLIIGVFVAVTHDPNIIVQVLLGPLSLIPGIHIGVGA